MNEAKRIARQLIETEEATIRASDAPKPKLDMPAGTAQEVATVRAPKQKPEPVTNLLGAVEAIRDAVQSGGFEDVTNEGHEIGCTIDGKRFRITVEELEF